MTFFVDTNIVIDLISLREPFGRAAMQIFNLAGKGKIQLFCSANTVITTHYILRKVYSEEQVRAAVDDVLQIVEIIPVEKEMLRKGLLSSFRDFEDAVQIFCAYEIKNITGIITRDLKDFHGSGLEVFSPDEALNYIQNKLN